jgi:hypothetical protein
MKLEKNMGSRNYILGGGISGLIFSFYNPDFTVISPDVGGQITQGLHQMTWIHKTDETKKLLSDLEVKCSEDIIKIGYYCQGEVRSTCNYGLAGKIIKKKMSEWNFTSREFKVKDTTLSVPGNTIEIYRCNLNEVISKLSKCARVVNDYINFIGNRVISGIDGIFEYDELVSTIPAPVFWNSYQTPIHLHEFKSSPVTFIISYLCPAWYNDDYEMVYVANELYHTRVAKRSHSEYIYEYTGIMPGDVFTSLYGGKVEKHYVNAYGRVHSRENNPPNNRIIFLGRFAQWKHGSKIQDVIKKAINYRKER